LLLRVLYGAVALRGGHKMMEFEEGGLSGIAKAERKKGKIQRKEVSQ
jgi:hypothetical protein